MEDARKEVIVQQWCDLGDDAFDAIREKESQALHHYWIFVLVATVLLSGVALATCGWPWSLVALGCGLVVTAIVAAGNLRSYRAAEKWALEQMTTIYDSRVSMGIFSVVLLRIGDAWRRYRDRSEMSA